MEALRICLLLVVIAVCSGYSHHRRGGYHGDPHQGFYGAVHRGYGHHEPHYVHGSIYDYRRGGRHSSSDEDHSSEDHSTESEDHSSEEEEHDDRVYRFQVTDDYDAFGYTDDQGVAHGFLIDLMRAICERAHKTCYFMVDQHSHCWLTQGDHEYPGVGLLDNYYDGCLGFWQSNTRKNSLNFTLPFTPDVTASLHYKAGTTHENPNTVTGLKIGFVAGWPISHECFESQAGFVGNKPGKYTPTHYTSHRKMVTGLTNDEVSGIITVDSSISYDDTTVQRVDPSFRCTIAGASVMTQYGSPVIEWWNSAFLDMKADGSFRHLCAEAVKAHGSQGTLRCNT